MEQYGGTLRVAAYIRVSTDNNNQEDSYEMQQRYFMKLLSGNPQWISAGIYSDYGISGTTSEQRKGFRRLLRHCQEGRIDRIVTKSISRFSRNTRDFLKAMEILKEKNVTILFEKENFDTAIARNDLFVTILGAIAQEESQSIAANMRQGIQQRFPKGEMRNVAVYGYRYAEGEDSLEIMESGYRRRKVEIIDEQAKVVRRVFEEAEKGYRYVEIARRLNFDHIPKPESAVTVQRNKMKQTPVGTLNAGIDEGWTGRHVKQMLVLERYCGDALLQKTFTPDYKTHKSVKNRGELPQYYIEENHPAIVSREQYQNVQEICCAKDNLYGKKIRYPFSGRIVCTQCGRFYVTRNRNRNPIWVCPSTRENNGKNICHAEKLYERQLIAVCRKAVMERFDLIDEKLKNSISENKTETPENRSYTKIDWNFTAGNQGIIKSILKRMEQIHQADDMEHDLTFLQQQISRMKDQVEKNLQYLETVKAALDVALMRKETLGENIGAEEIAFSAIAVLLTLWFILSIIFCIYVSRFWNDSCKTY